MSDVETVAEGALLWQPSDEQKSRTSLSRYFSWLNETRGRSFASYDDLWQWSVTDLEGFWESIWEFCGVTSSAPYRSVLTDRSMPGARWFPGAELNYAEHALRRLTDDVAVLSRSELRPLESLTYEELGKRVAAAAEGLRRLGVGRGDRVAALMPNVPETLVAFLATASLGAVWSSCSPEFGLGSVVDRFQQIEPKVLLAVDGYRYNGASFSKLEAVGEIQSRLPGLGATVIVPYLEARPDVAGLGGVRFWEELLTDDGTELRFEQVPFDHPLWILYSSGTTGPPKGLVHGHGGILLEHLKTLSLHSDIGPGDRFFWFTTTGWMMWNYLIGGLLVGATVLLYDGSPAYPDLGELWRFAEETGMTYFGASAPYIKALMKEDRFPGRDHDLSGLKALGSTGAPLSPEGFAWVYERVGDDLLLGSVSGGTDICTAFVLSCPVLPVHAGELQCRGLGAKVEAFDWKGRSVVDEVGELVITEPLPSMPVYLWNDPDGRRYRDSYFEMFRGVWRHGDWIKITPRGTCVIYGRSDSTLNRGGVRMGTSEFYRVIEDLPEIADSLVVDTGRLGKEGLLYLFVVLEEGAALDEPLESKIRDLLRTQLSPRHVPDEILRIAEVPCTLNGKKMEVPVKRILLGTPAEEAAKPDAMANPHSIRFFAELAGTIDRAAY